MFLALSSNINNLKKLNNLRNSIVLNNSLVNNKFIIFGNISKIKNLQILNLKIEIKKLNSKSFISNQRFIKLDNKILDLMFLGSHILIILISNLEKLLKLINLLNNEGILFFFLYANNLSIFTDKKNLWLSKKKINILFNFNFIIYKLIIKIFLLLSIFIRSIFISFTLK